MSLPTGRGDQRIKSWGLTRRRMPKDRSGMREPAKERMGGTSLIGGLYIRRHESHASRQPRVVHLSSNTSSCSPLSRRFLSALMP